MQFLRARGRIGTLIADRWRIERRLGSGGTATVYAARHERIGGRVAIKVLHPDASPAIVRRFQREGYLANTVDHPDVVRVYDDGITNDGCAFLVMDLLEGKTLHAYCAEQGGRLSPDRALSIARAVLAILAAAHEKGIAHRDVTPANVFLTQDGRVKLLDFGIARDLHSEGSRSRDGRWGTLQFMAPERVIGRGACGPGVDVWSVGVMLFLLVSGNYPFNAKDLTSLAAAYQTKPPTLDLLIPGFSSEAARVIDRALTVDPNERWAEAGAMARAFDKAAETALRSTAVHPDVAPGAFSATVALVTRPQSFYVEPVRPAYLVAGPSNTSVNIHLQQGPAPHTISARMPAAQAQEPPGAPSGCCSVAASPSAPAPSSDVRLAQQPMLRSALTTVPSVHRVNGSGPPANPYRHHVVIGFLALSVATFITTLAYSVRAHAKQSPSVTTIAGMDRLRTWSR